MYNVCMYFREILYFILLSVCVLFSFDSWDSSIMEGNQYIKLREPIHDAPKLLEFFSFYCPHCYQFETVYNILNNVQKTSFANIIFYKYHVNFLGNLGKQLTHAWAVAIVLGIEDKIGPILFIAIQQQNSIHNVEDIKKKFIQFGIDAAEYDRVWNSILVKSLILDQERAAIKFQLRGVPSIFINGKYMIRNDKLDISSVHAYIKQFSELLHLLIEKK